MRTKITLGIKQIFYYALGIAYSILLYNIAKIYLLPLNIPILNNLSPGAKKELILGTTVFFSAAPFYAFLSPRIHRLLKLQKAS